MHATNGNGMDFFIQSYVSGIQARPCTSGLTPDLQYHVSIEIDYRFLPFISTKWFYVGRFALSNAEYKAIMTQSMTVTCVMEYEVSTWNTKLTCMQLMEMVSISSYAYRDGVFTFENELSYSSSYFQAWNFGTIVTSVTITTINIWLEK